MVFRSHGLHLALGSLLTNVVAQKIKFGLKHGRHDDFSSCQMSVRFVLTSYFIMLSVLAQPSSPRVFSDQNISETVRFILSTNFFAAFH